MSEKKSQRGQSMIILVLFIAFFFIFSAGLFGFELNRMEVAREQLRTATEAAALAGAATLASSDNTNPTAAQTSAENTALTSFQANSIIGKTLSNAAITYSNPDTPAANDSALFIQFLDPNNNNQPVSLGDPNGKTVQVTSFFGLQPAFGAYLGINTVTLSQTAYGGVPQLDIALCFDVSASIDDETPVTFVKRVWNANTAQINYTITSTTTGSPAGSLAEGPILQVIGPPAIGSSVDGLAPQNLDDANTPGKNSYPLAFSEAGGRTGAAVGLRGKTNTGSPPGNYPGSAGTGAGTGTAQTFTDVVVNIDNKSVFGGFTYNGFSFPDVATLVEAARGNLENAAVFASSKASVSVPPTILPTAGYQAAYVAAAKNVIHPLGDAQQACQTFLNIMNTDCDSHFSLVAFTSNAGTSATDVMNMDSVDPDYTNAGTTNCPVPLIALNPTTGQTNYTTIYNELPNTVATSGTNIGDAINTAVSQLTTHGRPGAHKAIVLFTDGEPTAAGPLDNSDPWHNARLAAVKAQQAGIPIYSIGLAQTAAIIPSETSILTASNSSPSTGGVSGIAGHGGQFWLVTNNSDLRLTFENLARQLVQLVKS
jgi:hypothetical protein